MAGIGLSYPVVAKYAVSSGTITYSDYAVLGKAINWSLQLEGANDNNLYADNEVAETEKQFAGGTLTINTDEIDAETMATLLGLDVDNLPTIAGLTTTGAKVVHFDDSQAYGYFGIGAIRKVQVSGVTKWQAIMLNKVSFNNPNNAFTTQGETIEWQTPEIEATVTRDDSSTHEWQRMTTLLDTEADAKLVLQEWLD